MKGVGSLYLGGPPLVKVTWSVSLYLSSISTPFSLLLPLLPSLLPLLCSYILPSSALLPSPTLSLSSFPLSPFPLSPSLSPPAPSLHPSPSLLPSFPSPIPPSPSGSNRCHYIFRGAGRSRCTLWYQWLHRPLRHYRGRSSLHHTSGGSLPQPALQTVH